MSNPQDRFGGAQRALAQLLPATPSIAVIPAQAGIHCSRGTPSLQERSTRLRVLRLRLLADADHLGLHALRRAVAELLVTVLVDAAAGVAARGPLLGVGELDVGVYGLDHRLLVGGESGAGLHVPAWDAFLSHPAEPRAAVRVYDVGSVALFGQCDLDVEKAVGEHDDVDGVLHRLDAELLAQIATLLLTDAAHGELAHLLAVVAQVVGGPDHLVQDNASPRARGLPLVPRWPRQPELHRPSRQEQRELRKTVDLEPFHNGQTLRSLTPAQGPLYSDLRAWSTEGASVSRA